MTPQHRVVITGAGTINPLGHDAPSTLQAMTNGHCAIGPLNIPDVDRLKIKIGAGIKGYTPDDHFNSEEQTHLDRASQLALIAARQAIAQSNLTIEGRLAERSGVIIGTAGGGIGTVDANYRKVYGEGKNRVHPFTVPKLMHNAAASQISIAWGLKGPTYTVSTACASANHAIGQAFRRVQYGECDVMIAGGTDAMLSFGGIKAWEGLRVLSPDGCRPFDALRNGMVIGEGAAIFVIETLEHARGRGAPILLEITGFAETSDAANMLVPSIESSARAMTLALRDANLDPTELGYINAHGTGTIANDKVECAAVQDVFGINAKDLYVSSTKSMHGHLMGAAGAVEMLAVLLALRDGIIAPTIGLETPEPQPSFAWMSKTARKRPVRHAISNAFAFGGSNAVLVFGRA